MKTIKVLTISIKTTKFGTLSIEVNDFYCHMKKADLDQHTCLQINQNEIIIFLIFLSIFDIHSVNF